MHRIAISTRRSATTSASDSSGSTSSSKTRPEAPTDFVGIVVEHGNDLESLVAEPSIAQQSPAKIAGPHQKRSPGPVGTENPPQLPDHLLNTVAHAGMPELAEVSQVFPDLGVGKPERSAQLEAGYGVTLLAEEAFQLAEVEAEAADGRPGHMRGAPRLDFRARAIPRGMGRRP